MNMNISTHVISIEKMWTDLKENISKYEKDSLQFQNDVSQLNSHGNVTEMFE